MPCQEDSECDFNNSFWLGTSVIFLFRRSRWNTSILLHVWDILKKVLGYCFCYFVFVTVSGPFFDLSWQCGFL